MASDTPDRIALRRWLAAVGLLDSAEGLAARGSGSEALIVCQAGAETALGLLAGWAPDALPSQPKWDALVGAARQAMVIAGAIFPQTRAQINSAQTLRNGAVHRGAAVPLDEARAALSATRELVELLPIVSAHFKALPPGAGIAGAVAELVDAPEIQAELRAAENHLRAENVEEAADSAARVLEFALGRAEPRIGGTDEMAVNIAFMHFPSSPMPRDLVRSLQQMDGRISDLERWVLAAILGIRPPDFARLQDIVGWRTVFMDGHEQIQRAAPPSLAETEWAVRQVAELVYRLQEVGALIEGDATEVWKRRRHS